MEQLNSHFDLSTQGLMSGFDVSFGVNNMLCISLLFIKPRGGILKKTRALLYRHAVFFLKTLSGGCY